MRNSLGSQAQLRWKAFLPLLGDTMLDSSLFKFKVSVERVQPVRCTTTFLKEERCRRFTNAKLAFEKSDRFIDQLDNLADMWYYSSFAQVNALLPTWYAESDLDYVRRALIFLAEYKTLHFEAEYAWRPYFQKSLMQNGSAGSPVSMG
jgi:hypothetical protein